MLILTRGQGQSIMVGDDIEITIVNVSGGQAKVAIQADKSIPVHRTEVYLRIRDETVSTVAKKTLLRKSNQISVYSNK